MTSTSELLGFWAERDYRYSHRRIMGQLTPLTKEEIAAIRAYRTLEIERLPLDDRSLARLELTRWAPPNVAMR